MTDLVRMEVAAGVARLTLNRPDVMNALSFDTLGRLGELLGQLSDDRDVRVVILTGSGDRAFCAGADLKERVGFTEEQTRAFVTLIGDTFSAVAALPQPVIAAMNGVAYGGGLELALACDLRVAVSGARMGLTETSLAIIPGAGGTQRLPQIVGTARAKELIYCARRLDADEAFAMGLVNRVAPAGELMATAQQLAHSIAANGPLAVRAAKEAIDVGNDGLDMATALVRERQIYLEQVLPSSDRLEALAAFREKQIGRA
ncbi:MAG: methylglutaconyl-CoA hydratase, partial [Pseudohongiellaceae bacterium]